MKKYEIKERNPHLDKLSAEMRSGTFTQQQWDDAREQMAQMLSSFVSDEHPLSVLSTPNEDSIDFKESLVRSFFEAAGIKVLKTWALENQYWPRSYVELRVNRPWWLVKTEMGLIEIGPRKRVIEINWEETRVRTIVTEASITKSETMVHAYNHGDVITYLQALKVAWRDQNRDEMVLSFLPEPRND